MHFCLAKKRRTLFFSLTQNKLILQKKKIFPCCAAGAAWQRKAIYPTPSPLTSHHNRSFGMKDLFWEICWSLVYLSFSLTIFVYKMNYLLWYYILLALVGNIKNPILLVFLNNGCLQVYHWVMKYFFDVKFIFTLKKKNWTGFMACLDCN